MRKVSLFVFSLFALLLSGRFCPLEAQPARRLGQFTSDEELTQELLLESGLAVPMGNTSRNAAVWSDYSGSVAQGAGLGGRVGLAYRFYPLAQMFIGADLDAFWLSYPYRTLELPAADSYLHVGWGAYALSATIGGRIPLGIYGLYFTTHAGVGYGLMCSPAVTAVEKYAVPAGKDGTRQKTRRSYSKVVSSTLNGNVFLSGGFGVEYRFRQRWIAKAYMDYSYMPSKPLGSDQWMPEENAGTSLQMIRLSAFVVGVGISYAF